MIDKPVDAVDTKARRIAHLRDELAADSSKLAQLCTVRDHKSGIQVRSLRRTRLAIQIPFGAELEEMRQRH